MSDIVVIKLVSGEEVIAREVGEVFGMVYEKPRVFQMMQTQQGMGAALVPYIMSAPDETVSIAIGAIVTKIEAPLQIETAYLQQTSGLDLSSRLG
jgi:hypothetical protein